MTNSMYVTAQQPGQLRRTCGAVIDPSDVEHLQEMLLQSRDFYASISADPPWTGYVAIDVGSNRVIGCCGFQGNPNPENEVEISYHTFGSYEGRGFATRMAGQLIEIFQSANAGDGCVIAHTLAEKNASTTILEKHQFSFSREIDDPQDGPIWRWEKRLSPTELVD